MVRGYMWSVCLSVCHPYRSEIMDTRPAFFWLLYLSSCRRSSKPDRRLLEGVPVRLPEWLLAA